MEEAAIPNQGNQVQTKNLNQKQVIGSGRFVSNGNLKDQDAKFKPLPMFDNSGWNPLNSSGLFQSSSEPQDQESAKSRLPVFSTLSK